MAEIKSTLDLIMEKTRNLTLTEEERAEMRRKEVEGKVKGLWRKFLDGLLDPSDFKAEITSFEPDDRQWVMAAVIKEGLNQVDPEIPNAKCLFLLKHAADIEIAGIQDLISGFHKELAHEKEACKRRLMKRINDKGISGSSVMANMSSDGQWRDLVARAKEDFHLKAEKLYFPAQRGGQAGEVGNSPRS